MLTTGNRLRGLSFIVAALLGQVSWAQEPKAANDPICRFYAEVSDPASGDVISAGFRGQIFVEPGSKSVCFQDRSAVARSSSEKKLICSERFGAYDVLNVAGYGEYTVEVMTLFKHGSFGLGKWRTSANPYDQKVGFSRPWTETAKPGQNSSPGIKYGFVTQGGACNKVTPWALRMAATRLALKADGATSDPNTTTLAQERITNPELRKELQTPTVIHPDGIKQYSIEQLTKAIRQSESTAPAPTGPAQ